MLFLLVDATTGTVWLVRMGPDNIPEKTEKRLFWIAPYNMSDGTTLWLSSRRFLLVNDTELPLTVSPLMYIDSDFLGADPDSLRENPLVQQFLLDTLSGRETQTEAHTVTEHGKLKYFGYDAEAPVESETVSQSDSFDVSSWTWVTY